MEGPRRGMISHVLVELNFVKLYRDQGSAAEIADALNQHGLYLVDYYEKVRRDSTIVWCTGLFSRRRG